MDVADYVELIGERHPELSDELFIDGEPNATMASGALAALTRNAIDRGHRSVVDACFETVLVAWDRGDDHVQNAVGLSYLRHLNFRDGRSNRAWAWPLLHPRLQKEVLGLRGDGAMPPE